jgi:hypothetical protein
MLPISEVETKAMPSSKKSRYFNFMALYVHQLMWSGAIVYAKGRELQLICDSGVALWS